MKKITRDEMAEKVAARVAQGGWTSIYSLVDSLPDQALKDSYYCIEPDEDEEEEEE